jgi:hypothetical protein
MSRIGRWFAPRPSSAPTATTLWYLRQSRPIEASRATRSTKYAANTDATFRTRAVAIKEERAELVKHHLDVLWHDYFKPSTSRRSRTSTSSSECHQAGLEVKASDGRGRLAKLST